MPTKPGDCPKCKGMGTHVVTRKGIRWLTPCWLCCETGWFRGRKHSCPPMSKPVQVDGPFQRRML